MTFKEALDNHTIAAVRRSNWHEQAKLELPLVIEGKWRGLLCTFYDPSSTANSSKVPALSLLDDDGDWLPVDEITKEQPT